MSADEVKGELEQVENELEMNLVTNRNVIEQYQQRQAQVCLLCCRFIRKPFTILPDRTVVSGPCGRRGKGRKDQ